MCPPKDKGKEKMQGKHQKRKRTLKGKLCPPKDKGKEKMQRKTAYHETPKVESSTVQESHITKKD